MPNRCAWGGQSGPAPTPGTVTGTLLPEDPWRNKVLPQGKGKRQQEQQQQQQQNNRRTKLHHSLRWRDPSNCPTAGKMHSLMATQLTCG